MSATVAPAPSTDPDADGPTGRGRRRTVVLLVALLVVGAAAWWLLLRAEPVADEVVEGEIVTLDPLTTTTGTASLHHARVGLAIVLTEDGDEEAIRARTPLIQDALLRAVAERDADTLRSAEGSEQLRRDLTDEAHQIWSPEEISRVVLVELLVQ